MNRLLLAFALLAVGCVSQPPLVLDAQNPSLALSPLGLKMGDRLVTIPDVLDALDDRDIPKTRVIHIYLDPSVRDLKPARQLIAALRARGYPRAVLVTSRHAESFAPPPPKENDRRLRR